VVELNSIDGLKSLDFGGAIVKLELLDFCGSSEESSTGLFSRLSFILSLKVFNLEAKLTMMTSLSTCRSNLPRIQTDPF
jgi:hypothetical protein